MKMSSDLKQQLRQQVQGALSLDVAFIGVTNGLFRTLHHLGRATSEALATAAKMDPGYVHRWCEAAYAYGQLEESEGCWVLSEMGAALRPEAPSTLMSTAVGAALAAHMAERAAALMRTGERPGESALAERETILPWYGAMMEANFRQLFEDVICPAIPAFAEADSHGGLVVDLGCGNGWYLRTLAHRYGNLHGLGLDGFAENIAQAQAQTSAEGLAERLHFSQGNIQTFQQEEAVDLIAMNRSLHHVWSEKENVFAIFREHLKPGGSVVIWEPAWPADVHSLREPARRSMAFQNLSEYIQGNHFLQPEEIVAQFCQVGMESKIYLFANGIEAVIVGRCDT
ncbi:MAG: class I SAM-dependent methyltransferase [Acidobacteriaceae bacterium]